MNSTQYERITGITASFGAEISMEMLSAVEQLENHIGLGGRGAFLIHRSGMITVTLGDVPDALRNLSQLGITGENTSKFLAEIENSYRSKSSVAATFVTRRGGTDEAIEFSIQAEIIDSQLWALVTF